LTQHDRFAPTLFVVHLSFATQNADEPVKLIANGPDFVELVLPSLNHLVTRKPPSTAPKSEDVTVGPPRDLDQPSDPPLAFPWPTAGTTNTTIATAPATMDRCFRFIPLLSMAE
jgi:hypothetical protein